MKGRNKALRGELEHNRRQIGSLILSGLNMTARIQELDGIARAARAWCAAHPDEGSPYLRDLLHGSGYDPRPMEPEPDVWFPPEHGCDDG